MNIKPIKTETDYQVALERFELLFDAKLGTPESDEADILALLIDEFENKNYSIEAPDPIEAIKIRMKEMQDSKPNQTIESFSNCTDWRLFIECLNHYHKKIPSITLGIFYNQILKRISNIVYLIS